ncbi:MAG: AAA family ATPase [Candidatus Sumerlaeia bacterium]|nr:AAA family ATPase [Candidatus Sumerlaeia bacterium]
MATSSPFPGNGVILGRFLPPHLGHDFAVNFARRFVGTLRVYILSHGGDEISLPRRMNWLREMFPDVEICSLEVPADIDPAGAECMRWAVGRLSTFNGGAITHYFSSEESDKELAGSLNARWIAIDPSRQVFPISSRQIRKHPLAHWEFLPTCVRPHYVRRICLYGPESTGKSILAQKLARHYKTIYVPEYARTLAETQDGVIEFEDTALIAGGHAAAEDSLARHANRLLFCDTDTITTTLWCDTLYSRCYPWIREWADRRSYDLHLLLDIDVPWVVDPVRTHASREERKKFFDRCMEELERRGRPYFIISGDWDERFAAACRAVDELLLPGNN